MTDPTPNSLTPPPELVRQWDEEGANMLFPAYQTHLCTRAARWGADQELEACCEWLRGAAPAWERQLRTARRPKPLSEADQALEALDRIDQLPTAEDQRIIRRALERLKEMEGQGND